MSLDPNTHTREDFTLSLTQRPLPDNAKPEWKSTAEKLRNLLSKLAFHKAMESNIHQTYMTPAASKNKVYFMWDFVGRTLVLPLLLLLYHHSQLRFSNSVLPAGNFIRGPLRPAPKHVGKGKGSVERR